MKASFLVKLFQSLKPNTEVRCLDKDGVAHDIIRLTSNEVCVYIIDESSNKTWNFEIPNPHLKNTKRKKQKT